MTEQEFKKAFNAGHTKFRVNKDVASYCSDFGVNVGDIVEVVDISDSSCFPVKCKCSNGKTMRFGFEELEMIDEVVITDMKNDKVVQTEPLLNQHYAKNEIQPIEFIQQVLRDNPNINPFEGACLKDIIKYSSRYGLKDEKIKEAKKIVDYSLWLLLEAMGIKVEPMKHNHSNILKGFNL